ncbi:MAG TPA: DMT family transporter [Gaiellaceae bacterium]|nr:DMT family transporter [Gaiellaceae bacterium]
MTRAHVAMLLALAAIWGAAFTLIEVALRDLAPVTVAAGRIAFAAATLAVVATVRRDGVLPALRANARVLALAALLNTAVPFVLIPWGQTAIDSGTAAILNASAPIFTAVFAAAVVHSQRVTGGRLVGFLLGFVGVALVVGAEPAAGGDAVLGALAVVAAAALYAAGGLYTGARLRGVPTLVIALGTMAWATLFTLPLGVLGLRGHEVGWEAGAAVLTLGVVATAVAYLLYFGLIGGAGASSAILVTYLVPPTALVYGATLLDEPVGVRQVVGLALVLAGVALGTGTALRRRRRQAATVRA